MNDRKRKEQIVPGPAAGAPVQLVSALAELPAGIRAPLELSLRHGMDDETIAAVAQVEISELETMRERALDSIAAAIGEDDDPTREQVANELRGLSAAAWAGRSEPEPAAPDDEELDREAHDLEAADDQRDSEDAELESEHESERDRPPPPRRMGKVTRYEGRPRERNQRLAYLLPVLLIIFVLAMIRLIDGFSDSSDPGESNAAVTTAPAEIEPTPEPAPVEPETPEPDPTPAPEDDRDRPDQAPTPEPMPLEPLSGFEAGGALEAAVSERGGRPQLALRLSGLPTPEGEYRAWLYTTVIDSESLGSATDGSGEIASELPGNWRTYEFIDVSVQEPGSEVHSGRTIARIPTADLAP